MNIKNTDRIIFKLYNPFSQRAAVKDIWTAMINKCPHSYYLSWARKELWLDNLPSDCNFLLVVGYMNESPVIAFFAGSTTSTFLRYQQVALNQTLIPLIDNAAFIEYNSILVDTEVEMSLESLLDQIPIKSWDEFHMVRCSPIYHNLAPDNTANHKYKITINSQKSYYVDLEEVRRNNYDYLALISRNRRKKIRRAVKEYEKIGEISLKTAGTVPEALTMFDEMVELHQKRWAERNQPGSLSTEYVLNSHKKLITSRFEHGEIQLLKVSAGNHVIGCLYNFVYDGRVLCADSGYSYLPANCYRPGFVCDYFAILHNAEKGLLSYDFMHGEQEYKKSLSTHHIEIQDITVQRKSMKLNMRKAAAKLYRGYRKMRKMIY
ncbi:MAG TPA: GNAT family N-acetyltransferase [Thermodesulfobacteriota bacterium]|nr:GNAT family N-acetyltransferase [Thermodesulfobacteriota bacterium]